MNIFNTINIADFYECVSLHFRENDKIVGGFLKTKQNKMMPKCSQHSKNNN